MKNTKSLSCLKNKTMVENEEDDVMKEDETHDFAIVQLDGVVYGYDIWRTMSGRDDEEVLDETHLLAVPDAADRRRSIERPMRTR